jgi:NADPH:quinone reductase-like Zn-dependent oxidoreductase
MRAITCRTLSDDGTGLDLAEVPEPTLAAGEVEIEVTVAAVTPADRMLCAGQYYFDRPPTFIPGLAGVGVVSRHGPGLYGRLLVGRRVFFAPGYARDGAWAQRAVADAATVVPLWGATSDEQAVGMGNALTAIGLIQTARELRSEGVVVNAAAGNLAGLIATRCAQVGMAVVGIVRSEQQAESLRASGMETVLVQGHPSFHAELEAAAARVGARVLLDSLGGGASVGMMSALPPHATNLVIGHLSREPMAFDALSLLLGRGLTVRAFGISEWMDGLSFPGVLWAAHHAQQLVRSTRMEVANEVGLQGLLTDYVALGKGASAGRTLVFPGRSS